MQIKFNLMPQDDDDLQDDIYDDDYDDDFGYHNDGHTNQYDDDDYENPEDYDEE